MRAMKYFTIKTLGCKVNRYESEAMSEQLQDEAWQPAGAEAKADLCIVNTCAVTQKAAMQSRQAARRAVRNHPEACVVVVGCYAQVAPEVFSSMQGVRCVAGNAFKEKIAELADRGIHCDTAVTYAEDISTVRTFQDLPITSFGGRTRPFLKIQDGCEAFCAYCIVPNARGPSRSLRPEIVTERVKGLKESGYFEVVLCGVNLGRYGQDLTPATSLASLVRTLDGPQAVQRLRLSSIEPRELSEKLIEHVATSARVCPHLHIPLQSGDDQVLKQMNRPYTSDFYTDLVHHIVNRVPDVAIGVDVMAGFPGETEAAFENTCRLVAQLPVSYLHVFPFSKHKGTAAADLPAPIGPDTIKNRCRYLRDIGQRKRVAFWRKFLGSSHEVLIEGKRDKTTGRLKGLTKNYIPVLLQGPDELFHQVLEVRLTKMEQGGVLGESV